VCGRLPAPPPSPSPPQAGAVIQDALAVESVSQTLSLSLGADNVAACVCVCVLCVCMRLCASPRVVAPTGRIAAVPVADPDCTIHHHHHRVTHCGAITKERYHEGAAATAPIPIAPSAFL
jgi:hypothetical protein